MPVRPPPSRDVRLTARERIELLCDSGSVRYFRSAVGSRHLGEAARLGDGVLAASGTIDSRQILCYAQDGAFLGGSLGEAHAQTIVRLLELAYRADVPVFALIESAGARMQEATAALGGYGRIFRSIVRLSGRVPQISVLTGTSAGGGSYSPALTDFIVMSETASMFLTGPRIVREAIGEEVDAAQLGGPTVHGRNGVCHFVAPGDHAAIMIARELLGYLPQNTAESPRRLDAAPPFGTDPAALVPAESRRVYDMRNVLEAIVDRGELLEVAAGWARNILTAFARLDGSVIGIVANQPRYLGGVLDADASEKAARFVGRCDTFGIPLVVLVDTPGFLPGSRQERRAVIRRGAGLVEAFAQATVPKVSVVLRQAFGGAYITMNAKELGADLAFAWPAARIGVMAASQAVRIVHRRELAAASDPAAVLLTLSNVYAAEHQSAAAAARDGYIDEVIAPEETRDRLACALHTLAGSVGRATQLRALRAVTP
jgi:acetyl-CoA carboxylase carboxyltransferase component